MSFTQARADIGEILDAVKTAWSVYPLLIEADNRDVVDLNKQVDPFLQCQIVYMGGAQLDMGDVPKKAAYGQILLSVVSKEGSGTVASNALLDFVLSYFELKDKTAIRTEVAEPYKAKTVSGWYYTPVGINFKFYR